MVWDQPQGAAVTGQGGDLLGVLVPTVEVLGPSGHVKCHCLMQGLPVGWEDSSHPSW